MIYKLLKKPLGISKIDTLFEIELTHNPIDICYIANFGFFFLAENADCLGLISLKGKVEFPWIGNVDKNSSFQSPSSLCHYPSKKGIIVIDNYGKRIRLVSLETRYVEEVIQGVITNKLNAFFTEINTPAITSCDTSDYNIFWTVKDINRVFEFNPIKGDLNVFMGDGKSRFTVSSNLQQCSLKMPSGIRCSNDNIFVCDSGNHCIRSVSFENNNSSILAGIPLTRGDKDDTGIKSLLSYPIRPRLHNNILYFADGQKLKQISLGDKKVSTIKAFEKNFFIDAPKDLYILEQI